MSGETWQTQKTNWGVEQMPTTWPNKIEGNISVNSRGGGRSATATATAATSTTLPNEYDDVFWLSNTGSETVKYISTANRQYNNKIRLISTGGACNLQNNAGSVPAGYAPLLILRQSTGSLSDKTFYENEVLDLTLTTAGWHITTY